ncbi:HEAT repeat protein [Aquisphaera giovannonii]|uniref:HEAT repeat protein n=1 Tax=Aquisphaera giovannonii TaxID=406548 RepID=A0A5B9VWM4_9BACT|nr:HEAT repeat domain-containing protein [Aquisphaera giovannonii]QEH32856.1 HEAT repeat protein [Aquisphaera giovannonii]
MRYVLPLVLIAAIPTSAASRGDDLPEAAAGWSISRVIPAPEAGPGGRTVPSVLATIATAPDGSLTLGRTSGDVGSVALVRDGRLHPFADGLGAVHGLEWVEDSLLVVHGGSLSRLRDADGDGRAEVREDLVAGLDPGAEAGHGPSAVRLSLDGFLYLAVGDRGLVHAVGKDGRAVRLRGGGVIRVRPDGSGLEVVSTGEYRPRSLVVTPSGDVFTYGPADARRWPASLTHHIPGAHFGYPYQYLTASFRCLPTVSGEPGGEGNQAACYAEDGLPEPYRGNFFHADPIRQCVVRDELRKAGGTFALARRTSVVAKGALADFRPVAVAITAEADGFWIAEESGRLHRLSYRGADAVRPAREPQGTSVASQVLALDHPAESVRQSAARALARAGEGAVDPLAQRLRAGGAETGRLRAVWALDAIDTAPARAAIAAALADPSPAVRIQAVRSCGLRGRRDATPALARQLEQRDPALRREAAVALGRIGDPSAMTALVGALGDPDRSAAWCVRTAIRQLGYPDTPTMTAALLDPRRREDALTLADESWSVPVVRALADALEKTAEPAVRGQIIADLAAQYRRPAPWDGSWRGPDPLAGKFPKKTELWDEQGMAAIVSGLRRGLTDADASVRLSSILALGDVGPAGVASLRQALVIEKESNNRAAIVESIAATDRTPEVARLFARMAADPKEAEPVRAAALDGTAGVRNPDAYRARLALVYSPSTPPALVARALPALARDGALPPNELPAFLENPSPAVRAAALLSLNVKEAVAPELAPAVIARLDDPSTDVREAAMLAAGTLRLRDAVPSLLKTAGDPSAELRPQAVASLCRMADPRAESIYREAAASPDPALRRAGAKALEALAAPRDPEVARASAPDDDRAARIGFLTRIALRQPGDPRKGASLFFESRPLACASCHSLDGKGAGPGPGHSDLTASPARADRARLIAAILQPTGAAAGPHAASSRHAAALRPADFSSLVRFLHRPPSAQAGH